MIKLRSIARSLAVVGVLAAGLFLFAPHAAAGTFTVTKTADTKDGVCDADCSLREAVIAANASPGPHTINLPSGTYVLSSANNLGATDGIGDSNPALGDLDINQNMTLTGAGAATTIIQGGPGFNDKLIEVNSKGVRDFYELNIPFTSVPAVSFSMSGVTLDGGHATEGYNRGGRGGAFSYWGVNGSTLTLDSIIVKNSVTDLGDAGGVALSSMDPNQTLARVQILNSTITGNASRDGVGGGIYAGSGVPILIQDSIITNNTSGVGGPGTNVNQGGGLWLYDDHTTTSTIDRTVISGNIADSAGAGNDDADGGGLYIGRTLTITNSTISGNTTDRHGGAFMLTLIANQSLTMTNVTVSGNTAAKDGGGGYHGLAFASGLHPTVTYTNVTVTNNHSNDGGATGSGGIYRSITDNGGGAGPDGHFYLRNTIVAGNHKGGGNAPSDLAGFNLDLGGLSHHNLIGTGGAGGLTNGNSGNIVLASGATARLGPLANNGGPTLTHALLGDSPALDAGDNALISGTDQRGTGWNRTLDAADAGTIATVDIGALEMHPAVADTGDVIMLQDTSKNNYTVYVGDVSLLIDSVTAVSSDPSILPSPTISGTGGTRTMALIPVAGKFGTVTVTLTATDLYNGVTQSMTDSFTVTVVPRPNLTVAKTHTDPWTQGDTGKPYTITVSNLAGAGPTLAAGNIFAIPATVTVVDTLPSGLTATAISGTGWSCTLGTLTCTRSDVLAAGSPYPPITVTVTVADDANPSVTNDVTVSGNADNTSGNNGASRVTPIVQTADLTVVKSHSGNYQQGQFGATYTLTVNNGGTNTGSTSGAYSVTETLPTGISFVSGTSLDPGWSCSAAGQVVTCTRSTALASPGSTAITITVNVARDAGTPFNTTAGVSGGGEVGSRLANNTSNVDSITVTPMPDLTVAKSAVGTFRQGRSAAYTITATNSGFAITSGTVTVTDTLPAGLTYTGFSGTGWTCSAVGQDVTCTTTATRGLGLAFTDITINVDVAGGAGSPVLNTAHVAGGGQIWTANDDSAAVSTVVVKAPDLSITKTHTDPFTQGQTGKTYAITVTNKAAAGPTFETVTVTDTLPTGLTPTAVSGGVDWTCDAIAGQTVTCHSDVVKNGGQSFGTITITVNVLMSAETPLVNTATVSGGGELNTTTSDNSASDSTTVLQLADLIVDKSHVGAFQQGGTGSYTVVVTNQGTGGTSGTITVTDTLPAGLTPTGGTSPDGFTCTAAGQSLTCTRSATMAPGAAATITIAVNVAPDAVDVTNSVTVSGGGEQPAFTGNNTKADPNPTTITPMPDMTVSKTANGTFRQGQNASYTITAKNSGFATTTGTVTVVDTLPAGLTYVSDSGAPWSCTVSGQVVTCTTTETQATGVNFTPLTINVSVAGNASTSLMNNVTVSGGGQIYTANDAATTPTTVVQAPDLTIDKSHTGTWTQSDTGKTYSIIVSNAGPGPTYGQVTVTDTLPTGLTPTAVSGTGWTCDPVAGQTVTCKSTDQIASGGPFPTITLTVNVTTTAAPTVTNTASVSGGSELPTSTGNNSDPDPTNIVQRPDLVVDKSHTGLFRQGDTDSYTIVVTNTGTGVTSGDIIVTDTLPAGLTPSGATSTDGFACTVTGQDVSCTRTTSMIVNATASITVNVSVAHDAATTAPNQLTNTASVSGGSELPAQIGSNNSDSDATTIALMPDLTVTKTANGTFRQGQNASYTITAKNSGFATSSGTVTVVDTLPTGLSYVSGSGAPWSCSAAGLTVTCTTTETQIASAPFTPLTLTVAVAGNANTSVTNSVTVDGGGQIWKDANDTATTPTTVIEAPNLTIDKSHSGTWTQGDTGKTYSIAVGNAGPGPTFGQVTVTDTLPTGLTPAAVSGTGWTCDPIAGQTVTCKSTDEIASGASFPTITLTVNVTTTAAPTVTNTATVSGGSELPTSTGNNSDPDPTDIVQLPDLVVDKSHTGDFAQGQVGAQYRIKVTNAGTGLTSGTITVTDTLPGDLTPTAATADTRFACTIVGQTVTCTTSAAMATNDASTITITVTVSKTAATSVTNSASVSGGGEQPAFTGNNSASNPTTIAQKADLTVTKSHAGNFRQGQVGAQYSITVSNNGTADTEAPVTMTDTLPAGLTPTAANGGATWSCGISGQTVTCTTSAVRTPGTSYPDITVTVNVGAHAAPNLTNTASVSGGGEVVTNNNTGSNPTTVVQIADLTVAKSHSGDFTQGQTGKTYSIVVTNAGDGPTDAPFTVSDTVPNGLTPTAAAGTDWACTIVGQTVTCNRSVVLSNSNSSTITLTVNVAPTAPISVTNTATVSGGGEVITNNNSSSNPTTVLQLTSTTLQVVNGQYSDKVTFTATVQPVVPGSVQFSVQTLGVVGSAPVNTATGKATFQFTIPLPVGSYDVVATYQPTNPVYLTSNSTPQPLTVTSENAVVLPAAGNPAVVPVAPGTVLSQTFTLSANITELLDGSAGDIGMATPVTFRLSPILGSASSTCIATTTGGGVGGTLTASCTFTNMPVDLYLVEIKVGGNYYTGTGFTTVAVYAVRSGSVFGQGTVRNSGVLGTLGFSMKFGPRDTVLGSFNYIETRPGGSTMQIRSAGSLTLSVSGKRAVISGRGTINLTGDYLVVIQAMDNGAGTTDQYAMRVTDAAGNIVTDLTFGLTTLSSGDIKVPPGY